LPRNRKEGSIRKFRTDLCHNNNRIIEIRSMSTPYIYIIQENRSSEGYTWWQTYIRKPLDTWRDQYYIIISLPFRADMAKTLHLVRFGICILRSDGAILCVPSYNHVVTCSANLRYWPYDTHTCAMVISSWTYKDDQMNISIIEPGVRINWHQCVHERTISASTYRNGAKMSGIIFSYIMLNIHYDIKMSNKILGLQTDPGSIYHIFIRLIIYKWN